MRVHAMPPLNLPSPQVFVIASYMRDLGVRVDQFPRPGETRVGGDFLESHGGKGSNQAIQAARCGARVAIVAAVGQDAPGERACELWRAEGLDARGVVTRAGQITGTALILVDDRGENQIVIAPGANSYLSPADVDAAGAALDAARVVVCQLETPLACTLHAFGRARAAGATTLLNSAPAPAELPAHLWALTDILIANEIEAAALSGCPPDTEPTVMAQVLLGRVGRGVAITLGSQGAMWCERGAAPICQRAPGVDVVDTTGAGDAFVGAFAAAWAQQPDPRQALISGVTAGSLACTRRGVVPALADAQAIARLRAAGSGRAVP